ncbi:MAG: DNA polymerase [Gammaproteobacteria bacterium]|nr:DNA polymerase [Gammaproteobacteria bacterium]
MNPFELIKSISNTKKDILENEKDYNAFMVNRGLSYFPDTVIYANEMNRFHHLDQRLQYHFLINTIRKRNRFSKWNKSIESENISVIKQYYGYSNEKARDVLPLLSNENLKYIRGRIQHGGIQR